MTDDIKITEATDRDAATNLLCRAKRIRDISAALKEVGRLAHDETGKQVATDIVDLARVTLGCLLIDTERAGLRWAARTKAGTQVGAETGFTLDDFGITGKQSAEWQELARKHGRRAKEAAHASEQADDAGDEPSPSLQPIEAPVAQDAPADAVQSSPGVEAIATTPTTPALGTADDTDIPEFLRRKRAAVTALPSPAAE